MMVDSRIFNVEIFEMNAYVNNHRRFLCIFSWVGGSKMDREHFYHSLAKNINQTLGRKAITAKKIDSIINHAKRVRQHQGVMGLWNYAAQLLTTFFTETEIERLKQSSQWSEFTRKLIQVLIYERVISPFEAQMLYKYI